MKTRTITAAAATIGVIALAGCGATITKAPAPKPTTATTVPAAAQQTPDPTPTPTAPLTGTPGTSFTVTDDGTGSSYDVTLNKVRQTVYPGEYMTPATPGDHYAAAQFTIAGDTGNTSDDANIDATAIGSDGQQYSFASVMTLPNFSYGEFRATPGIMVKGWVAFELPPGVTVASVQWAPSFTGSAATWTLGG